MKTNKSKHIILIVILTTLGILVSSLWFNSLSQPQMGRSAAPQVTLIVETLPRPPEVTLEVVPLTTTPTLAPPQKPPTTGRSTSQIDSSTEEVAYSYLYRVMDRYVGGTTLRLLESYDDAVGIDEDDRAWTYDNALVILALLARGQDEDLDRAKVLVDALVYAQTHDPDFSDGRVRDAYHADNFIDAGGTVQVTSAGSATGNMAWTMLALLGYWESKGGAEYLQAAEALGRWIYEHTYDERGAGGYTGGYSSEGQSVRWKATEHNIDIYAAFMRLYKASGDAVWLNRALQAKGFVQAMWNETEGHFWTGTVLDGKTINRSPIPEDTQSWTLLALGEREHYGRALQWTLDHLVVTCPGKEQEVAIGIRFSNSGQDCWFEGSGHTILAWQMLEEAPPRIKMLHHSLRQTQVRYGRNSGGLVAASPGGAETGYGFAYPHTRHIGATAWLIFVEQKYNPFLGIDTDADIPYEGLYSR